MTESARRDDWLFLFSSNQSPLYAQDIIDVLAAPRGAHYTFRYDDDYVEPETRSRWDALDDTPVVVLFSIQQKAGYHDPAFIPIRKGRVVRTEVIGSRYFVTFELGSIVSLPEPGDGKPEDYRQRVRRFTKFVAEYAWEPPYGSSASLGGRFRTDPAIWQGDGDQEILFERTADYLALTDSFRAARFLRFLGLKPTGKDVNTLSVRGDDPAFELEAGNTYDLQLLHAQRSEPAEPEPFEVVADGTAVGVIGRSGFDIASRYDRITLRIHAAGSTGLEDRETILAVRPGAGVQGPRINLRLRIKARRGRAIGVASAQSAALIAVALAGALTPLAIEVRITMAVAGAIIAAGLQLIAAPPPRAPWVPGVPSTTPQPAKPATGTGGTGASPRA